MTLICGYLREAILLLQISRKLWSIKNIYWMKTAIKEARITHLHISWHVRKELGAFRVLLFMIRRTYKLEKDTFDSHFVRESS